MKNIFLFFITFSPIYSIIGMDNVQAITILNETLQPVNIHFSLLNYSTTTYTYCKHDFLPQTQRTFDFTNIYVLKRPTLTLGSSVNAPSMKLPKSYFKNKGCIAIKQHSDYFSVASIDHNSKVLVTKYHINQSATLSDSR